MTRERVARPRRPPAQRRRPPSGAPGIPRQPRSYLWQLLGLLIPATIFEGYDITIFHLCTPDIAATFHLGNEAIGLIASIVRFGTVMSFLVISCSDRVGRKPVISVTVLGYGLFTMLTGLSRGLVTFTLFQSCSQVFLASEFGMAIIIISEEFPDELRGRAIAGFHMAAFVGVAVAGQLYGYMAESAWGWRGMYLLGIAPLLLVAFLRQYVRETAALSRASRHADSCIRTGARASAQAYQVVPRPLPRPPDTRSHCSPTASASSAARRSPTSASMPSATIIGPRSQVGRR